MSNEMQDTVHRIEEQGCSVEVGAMRLRLIKHVMHAPVDKKADYVLMTGCHHVFRVFPLRAVLDLLEICGLNYTLLSREYCCTHSLHEHDDMPTAEQMKLMQQYTPDFLGRNLEKARELGAKTIITYCANCCIHYKVFSPDSGLPIVYWTDVVSRHMKEKLGDLGVHFDFYEGCHREQNALLPGVIDPAQSKYLLNLLGGISYEEIPPFCCKRQPEKIFAAMKTKTLVIPTPCCFGRLSNLGPPEGVRIRLLAELLRDAYIAAKGSRVSAGHSQLH